MREEFRHDIDPLIDDFTEKYSRIIKFIKPYQIKILSFYCRDCKDELIRYVKYWEAQSA